MCLFSPSSLQDVEKLADSILKSVLTLSTVYYWLPKSQGNAQSPPEESRNWLVGCSLVKKSVQSVSSVLVYISFCQYFSSAVTLILWGHSCSIQSDLIHWYVVWLDSSVLITIIGHNGRFFLCILIRISCSRANLLVDNHCMLLDFFE